MEQCRHSCNDCNPELTFQCGSNIDNSSSIIEDSDGEHEFKECIDRGLVYLHNFLTF
jgi:hypothetical protein